MSLAMVAAFMLASVSSCFATTGPTGTTPAHLTVPATPTDFTISEKVTLTGTANSVDLTVSDLTITNNAKLGKLSIDSIKAEAEDTWTIVEDTTDFARMGKDTNKFSIVADGTHDLTVTYDSVGVLDPSVADAQGRNSQAVHFTGKTGIKTAPINDTKVADLIATVSIV